MQNKIDTLLEKKLFLTSMLKVKMHLNKKSWQMDLV